MNLNQDEIAESPGKMLSRISIVHTFRFQILGRSDLLFIISASLLQIPVAQWDQYNRSGPSSEFGGLVLICDIKFDLFSVRSLPPFAITDNRATALLRLRYTPLQLRHGLVTASLQLRYGFVTASLRLHYSSATASVRLYYISATASLRLRYGFTTAQLWLHYGFTTAPPRVRYGFTTAPLRLQYGFATASLRFHYGSTTASLRLHYGSPMASLQLHYGPTMAALQCHYVFAMNSFSLPNLVG